jgi:hypothetical protein
MTLPKWLAAPCTYPLPPNCYLLIRLYLGIASTDVPRALQGAASQIQGQRRHIEEGPEVPDPVCRRAVECGTYRYWRRRRSVACLEPCSGNTKTFSATER